MHRDCALSYSIEGSGPPVLLIQGVGVQGAAWKPQVDALSQRFQCLYFDNRGMAKSQPVGEKLSIELMAEDARALMDAAGFDSAHVIGHSMGGLIAQELALKNPKRVKSLALLCTFSRGKDVTGLSWKMFWLGLRSNVGPRRMRRHAFLEMVLPPDLLATCDKDVWGEKLAPLFGHDLADQPSIAMKQLSAMSRYDATPRLNELSAIKTLIVNAVHDPIARPELGRKLHAGIAGSKYVELERASHGVPIHDAETINRLLMEHLNG